MKEEAEEIKTRKIGRRRRRKKGKRRRKEKRKRRIGKHEGVSGRGERRGLEGREEEEEKGKEEEEAD